MKQTKRLLLSAIIPLTIGLAGTANAQETLKLGGMAVLEGTYTVLGEDSMRGIEMALAEYNSSAGGYNIELIKASTDGSPDSAIRAVKKLVEQDGVPIVIGPLSGSEGLAVKDYAKTQLGVTFMNGTSGAQDTTLRDPAPNFYRLNSDGAQWMKGLGEYVYNEKGWKSVATIGEDYSFIYTQVFGFALEYCGAGGSITERFWVPLGTKDFSSIIAALPDDVDAIYLGLGGGDAVNFLNQYQQAGGDANLIGGTIMVDQTVLSSKGKAKEALLGTPAAGPTPGNYEDETWQAFVKQYQGAFAAEKRFPEPSLFAMMYYTATKAILDGLNEVKGDLSNDQAALREYLNNIEVDSPTGKITLDENRQAIMTTFVTEVVEGADGNLTTKVINEVKNVNQTLGMDRDAFLALGQVGRDVPQCN